MFHLDFYLRHRATLGDLHQSRSATNKIDSFRFSQQPEDFRFFYLLLALLTLGSSLVLSGCGGIMANAKSTGGTPSGSAGIVTASPNSVQFGSVNTGSIGTSQISLVNSASSPVVISQLGSSNVFFSADGEGSLPLTLAAGGTAVLNLHFAPATAGAASGILTISSNSLVSPSVTIQLSGTGQTPQSSANPTLSINSSSVAFGNVAVGTPSTQAITLSSTGSTAVTVSGVSLTGAGFTDSGIAFPLTLNAGQSATLSLQFLPAATGAVTGQLTVNSNSSTDSAAVVALSGTGIPLQIALNWDAPSGSTIVGYNVYRTSGSSSSFQKLNSSVATPASYTDGTIQPNTTYQYYVTSVDPTGAESTPSNTATVAVP
jgi:hypothetical protein